VVVVVVPPAAAVVTLCLRCNHPAGNGAEAMIPFSDWNNPTPDHQTQSPQPKLTVQARSVFIFIFHPH